LVNGEGGSAEAGRTFRKSSIIVFMSPSGLRREVGQLLHAGFIGTSVPAELRSIAREFGLGGATLFARNIEEPSQVAELGFELARISAAVPAWVSIDQEGGRVARLRAPFTEWPPMASLGHSGDEQLAGRFARAMASELRAVGVSLDFAPVLDIHTNPKNPVIGDRALASDASTVAKLGAAIIRGLQGEGVAACGKHFPGHGDTSTDSHLELPLVEHPPEVLRERELVPFVAAAKADVAAIMTAHVFVPTLDEQRPATLSKRIITGLLREELGFDGVILSDDLEMQALTSPVPDSAVQAIAAGCDGVLICSGNYEAQWAALEAIVHAAETDQAFGRRAGDALVRNRGAKERFLTEAVASRPLGGAALRALVGCDDHRRIADEMARHL
jgi:beta-N-acetylhexosaminidase